MLSFRPLSIGLFRFQMAHSWLISGVILTTKWDDPPSTPYLLVFLCVMVTSPFHTFCQIGSWWPLQPTLQPVENHTQGAGTPHSCKRDFEHPTKTLQIIPCCTWVCIIIGIDRSFYNPYGGPPPSRSQLGLVVSQNISRSKLGGCLAFKRRLALDVGCTASRISET